MSIDRIDGDSLSFSLKRSRDFFKSLDGQKHGDSEVCRELRQKCRKTGRDVQPVLALARPSARQGAAAATDGPQGARGGPNEAPDRSAGQGEQGGAFDRQVGLRARLQQEAAARAVVKGRGGVELEPPGWHAPWTLQRVIAGHTGWVRSIAVDVSNEWFATGSSDSRIKIWEMATGKLKLTLTGHISGVRGLALSDRHPYLYSCGEDKSVKCWDLETNSVVRSFHGHMSGVYAVAVHPTLDIICSSGADSSVRVWDARSAVGVHVLSGHSNTVGCVATQAAEPQVISGSHDATVKLWDLAAGKCRVTLTNHKKSVRGLAVHPVDYAFATASPDNIKKWKCPAGAFISNFTGAKRVGVPNTLSFNRDGVAFCGGDTGTLAFFDWKTGHCFQELQTIAQPGSLDCEAGVYCSTFDRTGTRLLTGEADKTIKVWKEDPNATPQTHPVEWDPDVRAQELF
jgi:pleiotropic regulator 1